MSTDDTSTATPQQYLASQRTRTASGRFARYTGEGQEWARYAPQTDAQKRAYLEARAAGLSVRKACAEVGVGTWAPHQWAEHDPEFAEAVAAVKPAVVACLEDTLDSIAVSGATMPATVATLARLKAEDPKRYAAPERQEVAAATDRLAAAMERVAAVAEGSRRPAPAPSYIEGSSVEVPELGSPEADR